MCDLKDTVPDKTNGIARQILAIKFRRIQQSRQKRQK